MRSPTERIYEHNRRVWDGRVRHRLAHTRPASERDFENPLSIVDARGWMGDSVRGQRILCLAAGGGLQSALLAAAEADVTVVDISPAMLAQDREIAAARGLKIRIIEGSMDDLSMLQQAYFDIVVQPVSTCYVPDVVKVYQAVARVTVPGGLYLSQHKQPVSLQASALPGPHGYTINTAYRRSGPLPLMIGHSAHRERDAAEFIHRWEDLMGGLCRSGFVIEDLQEPDYADPIAPPGAFGHRSQFIPPYVAIKARRTGNPVETSAALVLPHNRYTTVSRKNGIAHR
jgi:SAM-dependent methyltransferase